MDHESPTRAVSYSYIKSKSLRVPMRRRSRCCTTHEDLDFRGTRTDTSRRGRPRRRFDLVFSANKRDVSERVKMDHDPASERTTTRRRRGPQGPCGPRRRRVVLVRVGRPYSRRRLHYSSAAIYRSRPISRTLNSGKGDYTYSSRLIDVDGVLQEWIMRVLQLQELCPIPTIRARAFVCRCAGIADAARPTRTWTTLEGRGRISIGEDDHSVALTQFFQKEMYQDVKMDHPASERTTGRRRGRPQGSLWTPASACGLSVGCA